jgi:hypothetical protein
MSELDARRVLSDEGRSVTLPDGEHLLRFSMAAIDRIEAKYGTVEDALLAVNTADGRAKFGPVTDLLCAIASPAVDRERITITDLNSILDVLLQVLEVDMGISIDTGPKASPAAVPGPGGNGNGAHPPAPQPAATSQSAGVASTTSPG